MLATQVQRRTAALENKSSPTWTAQAIMALYELPFMDLLLKAQAIHRLYHQPNAVQLSSLLSIKTGACPEDCSYCPQSSRYDTGLKPEALMPLKQGLETCVTLGMLKQGQEPACTP